jgi:hypothetical protein
VFFDNGGTSPPDATIIDPSSSSLAFVGDAAQLPGGTFDQFAIGLVGFGNPAFRLGDVMVRADVSTFPQVNFGGGSVQGNNDTFVMARVGANGTDSYLLSLDFNSGNIDLVRIDPGTQVVGIGGATIPAFDPTKVYTLELIAVGSDLTGNAYDNGALVATVNRQDATYSAGWAGVGTAVNDNAGLGVNRTLHAAVFDNTFAVTIPEPTSAMGLLALGLLRLRRPRAK